MMTALEEATDDALLVLYANGDPQAAAILMRRLLPRVLGQAYRKLADQAEAEDVAQEAMMRLWKIAPDWEPGKAQVSTWLYRVTENLCVDRLRRKRPVALDEGMDPADDTASAYEQMQGKTRAEALYKALETLPERQRKAVVLRHIEGLSNPEISEILGVGVEATESLIARGKRALSGLLARRKAELGYHDE